MDAPHTDALLRQRNGRTARTVGVTPQRFLAERDRYLARQLQLFPSGRASVWRAGPRDDLLGEPTSALAAGGSDRATGRIDDAGLYAKVRPRSGIVPAYVTGTLDGVRPGTDVAVAVNGRVRATGRLYADGGDARFSVIVPPETLRRGANRVEVLAIDAATARLAAATG